MEQIEYRLRDENKPSRHIRVVIDERHHSECRNVCLINFDKIECILDKEGVNTNECIEALSK